MLKEKKLYIIVSDYPYGNGEPFLEDELNVLAKTFDKVCLIITNPIHLNDLTHKFSIPGNVELKFYIPDNSLSSKWKALKFVFSESFVKEELRIIRRSYNLPLSFPVLRLLFSYLIHGLTFRKYLEEIVNSDNNHKASYYFYTYWCTNYTFGLALLKKKYSDIRAITRVHRWDLYMNVHKPPYLPFRSYIADKLDKIFSVSEDGKNYLLKTIPGIKENKVNVNFLGTTVNRQPSIIKSGNKIFILSISFISKVKRVDLLAESIALINDFDIEWHHIGGGAEEAARIEYLASDLLGRKKNIVYRFHGNLSKKEIYNLLDRTNFHVLINTSWSEGLPVSIMEAMSYGIPVIATDVGGNREIVGHEINGILLSSNPSKEEVADAIIKIYHLPESRFHELSLSAYNTWNTKFNNVKNNEKFVSDISFLDKQLYKICSKCILDNIDYPGIYFDGFGICNMCKAYDEISAKHQLPHEVKEGNLIELIREIKEKGKNHEYDCILGLSGGVDSCFVAYKAKEYGLRPLVVHLDNGWNSELAVMNIEKIVKRLGFDLYTHVINWNEFKDLQLSFIKASVIDIEILTDHAINAILYKMAANKGIKYILSGENVVTEGRLPPNWVHYKNDLINIKDIQKKFGKLPIRTFPTMGLIKFIYYKRIIDIKSIPLLDYIDYNKQKAKETIINELEWRDYGGKHYESVFTRFYQSYILPVKFHADKRKSHYSTLICSGQLTRNEALGLMAQPVYEKDKLKEDKQYVLKKLGLTETEFDNIMQEPIREHTDFQSVINYFNKLSVLKRIIKKLISGN